MRVVSQCAGCDRRFTLTIHGTIPGHRAAREKPACPGSYKKPRPAAAEVASS